MEEKIKSSNKKSKKKFKLMGGFGAFSDAGKREDQTFISKLSESNRHYERTPLLGPDAIQRQRII